MGDEREDLDDEGVEDTANEEERPMKQNYHNDVEEEEGSKNFLNDLGVGP